MFRVRMLAVLRQLEDGEFEKASSPLLYPYSCAQGGACVCHFSLCACCLFVCAWGACCWWVFRMLSAPPNGRLEAWVRGLVVVLVV